MELINIFAILMPVLLVMIVGIFYNNRRIDDLRSDMNERFSDMNEAMNQRFNDMNRRFNDMQEDIREIKNFMMEFLKRESGYTIRDK